MKVRTPFIQNSSNLGNLAISINGVNIVSSGSALNNSVHLDIGSTHGNIASFHIISSDLVVVQNLLNSSFSSRSLYHIGGTSSNNQIQLLEAGSDGSGANLTGGNILTLSIGALLYGVDGASLVIVANFKQTLSSNNNILGVVTNIQGQRFAIP